jgi:hypothetical protein
VNPIDAAFDALRIGLEALERDDVRHYPPPVEAEYEPSYEQFGEEQQGFHGDRR